jgi:hypothetical protein
MSEKKRGLDYMHVGGQNRPFQVNSIRQTSAFCEQMHIELDEYWSTMAKIADNGILSNQVLTITFVYSALFAGARKERIPVDFTYEDVLDWFEDAEGEEATEFSKPLILFMEILNTAAAELAAKQKEQPKEKTPKKR